MDVDNEREEVIVMDTQKALGLMPILILVLIVFIRISFVLCKYKGQKTRSPPQRRMYVGNRSQASLSQEPTIYVSPSNLPPPPKYEAMAPPSYEEVVGVHYPNYQPQPITQPITTAIAQSSTTVPSNSTNNTPDTVVTVNENRSGPATVAVSS